MLGSLPRLPNRSDSLIEVGNKTAVRHIELAAIDAVRAQRVKLGGWSSESACYRVGNQVLMI